MAAVLTFYETYITLDNFEGLSDDVSFRFVPSGVGIKNGFSNSPYAVNIHLIGGVTNSPYLHGLLADRGFEKDSKYEFILANGTYLEKEPHRRPHELDR